MSVAKLNQKECALLQCARMILADQCPPDRKHYLCLVQEDDTGDCTQCWNNFLWGLSVGNVNPCMFRFDNEGRLQGR